MKKKFMSAILIATIVMMAPATFAAINKGENKIVNTKSNPSSPIQVQYVGEAKDGVVLQVVLTKTDGKNAMLKITDGKGEMLHTERFSEKSFTRYIQVSPDDLKSIEVVFQTAEGISRKRFNLNYATVSNFKMEEVTIK